MCAGAVTAFAIDMIELNPNSLLICSCCPVSIHAGAVTAFAIDIIGPLDPDEVWPFHTQNNDRVSRRWVEG